MVKIQFRRKAGLGVHRFRVDGSWVVVRGGETVTCTPYDLKGFYIPGDPGGKSQYLLPIGVADVAVEGTAARMPEVVPDTARGYYNVVNPDFPDRALNTKKLRKKQAEEFLQSLVGNPLPTPDNDE